MYTEQIRTSVPNTHIRIGLNQMDEAGTLSNLHIHNEIEILAVKKGAIECSDGISSRIISSGEAVFVNSRIPHETKCINSVDAIFLQFNTADFVFAENSSYSKYLSKFINSLGERMTIFKSNNPNTKELMSYVDRCLEEYDSKKTAYTSYIKSNIYGILGLLYRNGALIDAESFFDPKTTETLTPVLNYIDENYASPITLDDLSAVANLNKYYFCRLFKKSTNSTVTDFINFVRIYKAEKMLTSSTRSVSDISYEVGFSSVSYFNRIFRKFVQLTPSQYRKIKYVPQI